MEKNISPIWRGNIDDNGKLTLYQQNLFKKYLFSLRGEYELILRKWKHRRSDNQNKYYWGVVIPILCETLGYSNDEMHEALKWKFLRNREREKLPTVKSTTSLSTVEFKNYIDEIVQWSAQEGTIIPDPNQVEYEEDTNPKEQRSEKIQSSFSEKRI